MTNKLALPQLITRTDPLIILIIENHCAVTACLHDATVGRNLSRDSCADSCIVQTVKYITRSM